MLPNNHTTTKAAVQGASGVKKHQLANTAR
jgi:hypothetical protein